MDPTATLNSCTTSNPKPTQVYYIWSEEAKFNATFRIICDIVDLGPKPLVFRNEFSCKFANLFWWNFPLSNILCFSFLACHVPLKYYLLQYHLMEVNLETSFFLQIFSFKKSIFFYLKEKSKFESSNNIFRKKWMCKRAFSCMYNFLKDN